MLEVSADFLAESVRNGNEPLLYMDIWPDKGPQRKLSSSSDWAAVNDPSLGLDANVSSTNKKGSLILATGTAAPITGSGFTGLVSHTMNYTVVVESHYHTSSIFSGHKKVHDKFTWAVTRQDPSISLPFLSSSTFLADTIRLVAQNTGNSASSITVRIVDPKGNQVGNTGSTAIGAATGQLTLDVTGLGASLRKGARYTLEIGYTFPYAPGVQIQTVAYTTYLNVSTYTLTGYTHTIALAGGNGFVIGGQNGYQATGTATRTLDVLSVPTGDGLVTYSDVVPGGADPTSLTITLYYTDSAVIAAESTLTNWTLHGVVQSGDTITAHQYWRDKN